jgi:hypothetical protein
MNRLLSSTLLVSTLLSTVSLANADVPPPPGAPGPDESPATGQQAPGSLPPPVGHDTAVEHPDPRVGNDLSDEWFSAMHGEIYYAQQYTRDLKNWAYDYHPQIYFYASWLDYLYDQYYYAHYDDRGQPRSYGYGRPTRGDFNYAYYYWIRPVYKQILSYSASYYDTYRYNSGHGHKFYAYKRSLKKVMDRYHSFVRCNYGFNGNDSQAQDDTELLELEAATGVAR